MEFEVERICEVRWLGQVDYDTAWQLQNQMAEEIAKGERPATMLLLEHPHVYTLGRRGKDENVLWDEAERAEKGVALRHVDRGGDVTYHGPGQLVGYPLLPLAPQGWSSERLPQADYVGYLRRLEEVIIATLARLGVAAGQRAGLTGVWVMADVMGRCLRCDPAARPEPGKIASIGVKVDHNGISRHGFALNVHTDEQYWTGIIPCGIDQVRMVNLADLVDVAPSMSTVRDVLIDVFGEVFRMNVKKLTGVD